MVLICWSKTALSCRLRVKSIFANRVYLVLNVRLHFVLLRWISATFTGLVLRNNQLHVTAFDSLLLNARFLCLEQLLVLHTKRQVRLMIFALVGYLHEGRSLLLIQVLLRDQVLAVTSRWVYSTVGHFLNLRDQSASLVWDEFYGLGLIARTTCLSWRDIALVERLFLWDCIMGWGDLVWWDLLQDPIDGAFTCVVLLFLWLLNFSVRTRTFRLRILQVRLDLLSI